MLLLQHLSKYQWCTDQRRQEEIASEVDRRHLLERTKQRISNQTRTKVKNAWYAQVNLSIKRRVLKENVQTLVGQDNERYEDKIWPGDELSDRDEEKKPATADADNNTTLNKDLELTDEFRFQQKAERSLRRSKT